MRVAYDATVLNGRKSGVGYYCEELLRALVSIDHTTEFFVFSHRLLDLDLYGSNGNVKLSQSKFFPVRAVFLHGLLPRLLDEALPDVCHYTNFLAPISEHRPYLVTIHDMGINSLRHAHPLAKRIYTKRLIPRVADKAKLILTNSEYSKWEIVRHLGICEDRIRVTPLAASPDFKPVVSRVSDPYFLYVGNLEPRKNLERLLEAFARLPQKTHKLVIVGNRWYKGGAAEDKARVLGIEKWVDFVGYVPREELPALYSGATAFVYPSLLEGFGLPVVEAMACGTPVVTSNNSSLKEVAGDAAMLVDATSVGEISEAMAMLAQDESLRRKLSVKGLKRAADFSWERTARLTLDAYEEAVDGQRVRYRVSRLAAEDSSPGIETAIQKTISYAQLFQYPLTAEEVRERLFGVHVDWSTFARTWESLGFQPDEKLVQLRSEREWISDQAICEARPHLRLLASIPFVRMIAFSGATAHRNMSSKEDLDLFFIVEDGKLWAVFLCAMIWAKLKGLRKRLCMNYLISDAALPLADDEAFTAQQVASLKPIYGKTIYDRFVRMNPFVLRHFPNFTPAKHRDFYPEVVSWRAKPLAEACLRLGPVQLIEEVSRRILSAYLTRKARAAVLKGNCDVLLEPRRLKLHFASHKREVLSKLPG